MHSYTSISFHKKSLVYASHTINAKADFNSHGFFTCKIFAKSVKFQNAKGKLERF